MLFRDLGKAVSRAGGIDFMSEMIPTSVLQYLFKEIIVIWDCMIPEIALIIVYAANKLAFCNVDNA